MPDESSQDAGIETTSDIVQAADKQYQERQAPQTGDDRRDPEVVQAQAEPAEQPEVEAEVTLPDGTKVSAKDLQEWREAHSQRTQYQNWQRQQQEAESRLRVQQEALNQVLRDPAAYEQMRQRLGLAQPGQQGQQNQPKQDVIDPIQSPHEWRYARAHQYRQLYAQRGQTIDEQQISDQVERDLDRATLRAQTDRINQLTQTIEATKRESEEIRQAREIEGRLEPLYKKYPSVNNDIGRRLVENELLRREYTGEALDFEAVVKHVSDLTARTVQQYTKDKNRLAAGTRGVTRGGGTRDPGRSAIDKLPDDTSAFSQIAELRARGKA